MPFQHRAAMKRNHSNKTFRLMHRRFPPVIHYMRRLSSPSTKQILLRKFTMLYCSSKIPVFSFVLLLLCATPSYGLGDGADATARVHKALDLADAGDAEAGWGVCRELRSATPPVPVGVYAVSCAYLALETGRPVDALDLLDRAGADDARADDASPDDVSPDNAEAVQLRTRALRDMGAAALARRDSPPQATELSPETHDALVADLAARRVIWGEIGTSDPARRFVETDAALVALDALLADPSVAEPVRRRARLDRLQALRDRRRFDDVLTEYEAMEREGLDLPVYALVAVADSALALRRPELAEKLYRRVMDAGGASLDQQTALYYALLESEKPEAAESWIAGVAEGTEPWRRRGPRTAPHWGRVGVDATAALHFAFTDRPHEAQRRLEPLVDAAPLNADLRQELATVYAWRGWPRASRAEYAAALALEPESVGARLGDASVRLDLWQWDAGEKEVERLASLYPENSHVERLRARAGLRPRWSFDLLSSYGDGDPGPSGLGTRESTTALEIQAPATGAFRPFLGSERVTADLPEGDASLLRTRAGVRWHRDARWAEVAVHADDTSTLGDLDDPGSTGFSLAAGLSWSDRWSAELRHATESAAVPIRARYHGIGGERSEASLAYRASDRFATSLGLAWSRFDDDNERREALLVVEGDPYAGPVYRLGLGLELSASDNTLAGVPYYNPASDATALVTVVNEWLGHRRYERRLVHRWALSGGVYDQEGFGTSEVGTLRYEHDWRLSLGSILRYGVQWTTWVYDGEREDRGRFYLQTGWHF